MGKEININQLSKQETVRPEDDERSVYRKLEDEFRNEIEGYEYFKNNGLSINMFKHSEAGKEYTKVTLMKKTKVLYQRTFEGYSDETRYQCMFFMYRDIFNNGLILCDKVSIEQEKLDKEKKIVDIVDLKGNKL